MVARLPTAARNAIPIEKDVQSLFYVGLIKLYMPRTGLRRGGCRQPRYRMGKVLMQRQTVRQIPVCHSIVFFSPVPMNPTCLKSCILCRMMKSM